MQPKRVWSWMLMIAVSGCILLVISYFVRSPYEIVYLPDDGTALCFLRTPEGSGQFTKSFTTDRTIESFHVAVRPRNRRETAKLSLTGPDMTFFRGAVGNVRFTCGRAIEPGTYSVTVEQGVGHHGATVAVTDHEAGVTKHQVLLLCLPVLLVILGVWVVAERASPPSRARLASVYAFKMTVFGLALIFVYLLFHEGGHALASASFGGFDLSRSDFFGLRGSPHSGADPAVTLEPWQLAVESIAGPLFPTVAGCVLYFFWRSRTGRLLRERSRNADLFVSGTAAMLLLPFTVVVPVQMMGLASDGDWRGFMSNVPGPGWFVYTVLMGIVLASAPMLWKTAAHAYRLLREERRAALRQTA